MELKLFSLSANTLYFLGFLLINSSVCQEKSVRIFNNPQQIEGSELISLAGLSNDERFKDILSNILIPRVVGTKNHKKVQNYITKFMENLNWNVEQDPFTETVPILGRRNFKNIVARLNPSASRYLALACHYDSKYFENQDFLGATDSAVPCAMMLDLAEALNSRLEPFRSSDMSLMMIFFDGEEAFKQWSPRDSIYGARHLVSKWKATPNPVGNGDEMDRVDVLMLLDLLGAPNPTFYDYYGFSTTKYFRKLCDIEDSLHELRQLSQYSPNERYFMRLTSRSHIEDDHLPFINHDNPVPVLHIIASPFPEVWHKMEDDYSALDFPTIDNLNKIFRVFTMSYLSGSHNQRQQRNLDF